LAQQQQQQQQQAKQQEQQQQQAKHQEQQKLRAAAAEPAAAPQGYTSGVEGSGVVPPGCGQHKRRRGEEGVAMNDRGDQAQDGGMPASSPPATCTILTLNIWWGYFRLLPLASYRLQPVRATAAK